jgi:hypothetical protein
MAESNGRFNPPNKFSEMVWNAVLQHITKQKTTDIIGIYNCKIFYSTYISLISSYSNLSNTDNIEIYLNEGLEAFFEWAKINRERFKSHTESFISYYSFEIFDPYLSYFSKIFFNEIEKFDSTHLFDTPYFMLLFEVDRPTDEKTIYDNENIFDIDISKTEEFLEIVYSNFKIINKNFDSLIIDKKNLKLSDWPLGKADNMLSDIAFFEKLVIKPFNETRCQICGNHTLREELSLNIEIDEGYLLPMCETCAIKNKNYQSN